MAVIESKLGNESNKINYLERAVELNPNSLSPKLILATEYLRSNRFKEALKLLRGLSEDDSKKVEVQLINAKAKIGLKEYDYALVLLKKLIMHTLFL